MDLVVYPQLVIARNSEFEPMQGFVTSTEGKRNCGAAGGAALANHWLGLVPGDADFITHHAFRMAAGDPRKPDGSPSGLGMTATTIALRDYGLPATLHRDEPYMNARDALGRQCALGIGVHYPTISAFEDGKWSGQKDFGGEHFVVLIGFRRRDSRIGGRNSTVANEGLFDGRCRKWGCAPDGAQVAPFNMYRKAMGDFRVIRNGQVVRVGTDKGVFIVVDPPPVD